MSLRVATSSLIAGALVVGNRGLGVLGSEVPSTGTHGPGYIYPSLDLPGDNGKEVRGLIVTPPGSGTLVAGEDSSFLLIGASDGEYSLVFPLFEDGADLGLVTATFNVGPVSLAGSAAAQASATAALQVLKDMLAAASAGATATGELAHDVPLAGAAAAQGSGTGALALTVVLEAAAVGQAGAAGALAVGSGLSAAASGVATATGEIMLSIALAGAALASAAATGEFTGQVSLSGAAAAAAGVSGLLQLSVPLGADAAALAEVGKADRTIEQQRENVKKGVSKTMKSRHLIGKDGMVYAVDIAPLGPDGTSAVGYPYVSAGLTTRDYLAAKAMQAMSGGIWPDANERPEIAKRAYALADEMLKARAAKATGDAS